jgi:hypothetical protein
MKKNKKAIVTLTIGNKYVNQFKKYCQNNWMQYCEANGFDLIVFDSHLDINERAKNRSPAWQKLLILQQDSVKHYEQVVWIDSDILINPSSPDICADIPVEYVGAVDAYSLVSKSLYKQALLRLYASWRKNNIDYIDNIDPSDYHKIYGLPMKLEHVVQTGVIVLSPEYHSEILQKVYDSYEDRGTSVWNYEMRPLSYELQLNCKIKWLDSRFNMIWPDYKNMFYQFLNHPTTLERIYSYLTINRASRRQQECATAAFSNNYFLHFASTPNEMNWPVQNPC